ncbi:MULTISPECIES: FAD-dependent oxidoreductase [unclassified Clostridium]|uniref:FAD-dependent oxidoreductase n=1 Tax=unclassified Clostridium TaxID=2614128 RepID=UPI0002972820|nr:MULTISPECIES: FAD-dependent oxidoreductase [unclassified Clostridium]EKQ53524.1 MAG: FAD/FMN-dependent dehydrogenase [Clostridium sp. Maddingley MBC34-26]
MSLNGLTGRVITPSDRLYPTLRLEYNLSINKFPLAIVYCYTPTDVSNAIKWCKKHHVGLRIRTGKHNYEGYSTANDVVVIDTTLMNKIEVNTENNTVKIQAGARLGNIYSITSEKGYAFDGGTCPTVGISGLVLGGGIGLSCRNFGLVSDNLIDLQLINAEGNLITANNYINRDLFWACRGAGGGNFGVATSYTFMLHKVNYITLIQLKWNKLSREKFINLWQCWLKTADRRISCFAGLNKNGIYLNGFFYGTKPEAEKILKEFLLLPGLLDDSLIEYVPYIDAIQAIGAFYGPPYRFKSTGRFVYCPLAKTDIRNLINYVDCSPGDNCSIRLYSLGGKIKDFSSDYSAYFYRDASYIIGITADWKENDNANLFTNWVSRVFNYVEPLTNGSYVNFPYSQLEHYGYEYYGENYDILRKIKMLYDPENVFRFPQSIRP